MIYLKYINNGNRTTSWEKSNQQQMATVSKNIYLKSCLQGQTALGDALTTWRQYKFVSYFCLSFLSARLLFPLVLHFWLPFVCVTATFSFRISVGLCFRMSLVYASSVFPLLSLSAFLMLWFLRVGDLWFVEWRVVRDHSKQPVLMVAYQNSNPCYQLCSKARNETCFIWNFS